MRLLSSTLFLIAVVGCTASPHEVELAAQAWAEPNTVDPLEVGPITSAAATVRTSGPTLSLVFLPPGEEGLVVRAAPSVDAEVIDVLDRYTLDVPSTGRTEIVHGTTWVEVVVNAGLGFIPKEYTSAFVPTEDFCDAPAITEGMLRNLERALADNDANLLTNLISPTHGLRVRYLRTEAPVQWTGAFAASAMSDAQPIAWGTDPATGHMVEGSFAEIVGDELASAIVEGDVTCNRLTTGAAPYLADIPEAEVNLNFFSIHVPATNELGLDWVTWTVGVAFDESGAFIATLNRYGWEG